MGLTPRQRHSSKSKVAKTRPPYNVVMPSGHGRSNHNPDMPGRALKRLRLLTSMFKARDSGDRREADKALAEANRWLRRYPFDLRVMKARDQLRKAHPVDPEDTEEANET